MNQIFKVIFDKTLGKAVAVSELVKNHGKGQRLQSGSGAATVQPTRWLPALSKLTVALGLGFVCAVPGVYAADVVGEGSVTVTEDEVVDNVYGKKQSSGKSATVAPPFQEALSKVVFTVAIVE